MSRVRLFAAAILLTGLRVLGSAPAHGGGLSFVEFEQATSPGVNGLAGATAVAISPNGLDVYTVGFQDDAITVWDRTPATNTITLNEVEEDGVGGVDGMSSPQGVAVSPDGACVYVATRGNPAAPGGPGTVASFSRSLVTGALTFVGLVADNAGGIDGIDRAIDVVVSPNSAHVYVAGQGEDAIAVFSQVGCALTQIDLELNGSGGVDGLRDPEKLAISADGLHLYAAARKIVGKKDFGTVVVFSRAVSGLLTFVEFQQDGLAGVENLVSRVEGLAVSPDGANVYAGSRGGSAVVAFTRDSGTGALTYLESHRPSGLAKGFKGASGVAVSPNNAYVYVAGRGDDALAVFSRDTSTGTLSFLEVHDDPVPGTNVLGVLEDVAASPDGTGVYAVAFGPNTLAAFTADVCGDGSTGVDEQCDDGCLAGTPNVCELVDDGDGCSSTCNLELCGPTPTSTCLTPVAVGGASLQIKDQVDDRKDQLKLNWKGEATSLAQYGNPVTTASYVICIYDGSIDPQPLASRAAPFDGTAACAGKDCWSAKTTSYQYGDKQLTPNGLKKIQLKEGLFDGKAKIQFQGAGIFLDPPALPLTLPVTVQVKNTQTADCWQAVYTAAGKNVSTQECVGGTNDGAACTATSECPGGACPTSGSFKAKSAPQCVGGGNDGALCTVASECPGGTCPS